MGWCYVKQDLLLGKLTVTLFAKKKATKITQISMINFELKPCKIL